MLTSFRRFKIIKVKFILEQATKSQRGEYRYRSTVSLTSVLDGGGWSTPRPGRFTPGKDPVPIVWNGAENLVPTGIRSPDRPARSESLYRLSYPAHP